MLIDGLCGLPIFFLHPAVSQVFQSPGFSGSESNLKVQVLEVAYYNHLNYPHDFSLLTRGNKTFLLEGEPVNNERSTIFE